MVKAIDLEGLFYEVCEEYLGEHRCFDTRGELGVFSNAAVIWLGVQQRLTGNSLQSSLSTLVDRIRQDTSPVNLILRPGRRIREGKISLNTGGVSRARQRLDGALVTGLFNSATDNIEAKLGKRGNVYLLDGQVITASRTDSILEEYGKTGNGEGELHFPRLRVVSAHNLHTGVARQLSIGTWHDSEVALAADVIQTLPAKSILVMDRFFDKPTFLTKVLEKQITAVVRVRNVVAKRLFGQLPAEPAAEKPVVWVPCDKKLKEIELKGRIIKFTSNEKGFRCSEFYFFTNSPSLSIEEVAALYRQRVMVEIFIRQLKQTLKLFFIRAKKSSNVSKEIYTAYLTFNLLRALMQLAADHAQISPDRMSFTATVSLCQAYAPSFLRAKSARERRELFERFVEHLVQTKLPKRTKSRSYPRVVKLPRDKYDRRAIIKVYKADEGK